eukprot:CAMPEP_0184293484 /NCGR_PEP_ID=MMETSP1049-20130417/4903_1 /TAXON_ID=77928 /ORGANISM="Proteomonas sulcata, Strain CCMP704" /LENGTH=125 /DNA_ID=CAMNT_0026601469 /DNA_START=111 /DNA_END=488 /DNA_ORIENTATION=-
MKKRENGTVSFRAESLWLSRDGTGLLKLCPEEVGQGAGIEGSDENAENPSLGLSFNLQISDAERAQRQAVQLPFQKHLQGAAGTVQDRGTTAGDLEDALQILDDEDEDEEEEEEEDDDPDDDLDI